MPHDHTGHEERPEPGARSSDHHDDDSLLAGTPVVVRRNAGLSVAIGAAASAIAIAYLWRAVETGAWLDWTLCLAISLIAGYYLAGLLDSRTPLVVADDLGVRIRLGRQWRGLPWDAVAAVEVQPRRSLVHDGRLIFRPHSLGRALDGLEVRGRRHAVLNQKMYGGALAVPLGLTTRTTAPGDDATALADGLTALARGRSDVLVVVPEPAAPEQAAPEQAAPGETGPSDETAANPTSADLGTTGTGAVAEPDQEPAASVGRLPWWRRPATVLKPRGDDGSRAEEEPDEQPSTRERGGAAGDADGPAAADREPEPATARADADAAAPGRDGVAARPRRSLLGGIGTILSRVAKGSQHDVDRGVDEQADPQDEERPAAKVAGVETSEDRDGQAADPASGTTSGAETGAGASGDRAPVVGSPVLPLRSARPALRAEVTREAPATTLGAPALHEGHASGDGVRLPEGRELRRPGSVDLVFESVDAGAVRPIARLGDPVEPLVIDDFVTEPAYDPVIGPELAAARTRVGLSVDELADRTRIRPHVIESIEVDDFAPCGGDFYARGHLRTLARVLGQDPVPLLQRFDDRYATAPVNARRVFEAELATGAAGGIRSTAGGANWGLLVGAVLVLVLVWGLVRLFATEPPELLQSPTPVLNGSAGVAGSYPQVRQAGRRVPVTLVAGETPTRVVVRDRTGKIVWAGELAPGTRKALRAQPPVRVRASDAGAVRVDVAGKDRGPVGEPGEPGRRTFTRPR